MRVTGHSVDMNVDLNVDTADRKWVEHILQHLLQPRELEEWSIEWDQERAMLRVDVLACGEHHIGFGRPGDWDVFTDGFEDFISESQFGWGQQRLLVDRPWRSVEQVDPSGDARAEARDHVSEGPYGSRITISFEEPKS